MDVNAKETSNKKIASLIRQVTPRYQKAQELVQETAIAIIEHAQEYGDCEQAKHLVRAVPVQQARSLILYFMAVSPIGVLLDKDKAKDKARFIKKESKAYNEFNLEKAKALSWWKMDADKAEQEAINVGSGEVFEQLIKSVDRILNAKENGKKKYDEAAIEAAKQAKEALSKARAAFLATHQANSPTIDPVAIAVAA